MAINWQSLLNLISPQQAVGGGLLAGGLLGDQGEPGQVTEARQYLRNIFTSPTGQAQYMGQAIGGLNQYFDPFFQQQDKQVLDNLQQRAIAGQPQSLSAGMGGPELAAIRQANADILTPQRQAFYGTLGTGLLSNAQNAAGTILQTNQPNYLAQMAALLGTNLLMGQNSGGTSATTQAGLGTTLQNLWNSLTGGGTTSPGTTGTPSNPSGLAAAIQQILGSQGQITNPDGTAITGTTGQSMGGISPSALSSLQVLLGLGGASTGGAAIPAGTMLPGALTPTTVASTVGTGPGAGASGLAGLLQGQGLLGAPSLSSVGGVASGLGAAGAGFGLGDIIGTAIQTPTSTGETWKSAGGGALAGDAAGFAIGGPIGAAIGAITGAIGGVFGQHQESLMIKAQAHAADVASQANDVSKLGNFWTQALGAAGVDTDAFHTFVQQQLDQNPNPPEAFSFGDIGGTADQPDAVAQVGAKTLLQAVNTARTTQGQPAFTTLDQMPGFRQSYIDYIMQNLTIQSGSGQAPVSNISQKGGYLTDAGL